MDYDHPKPMSNYFFLVKDNFYDQHKLIYANRGPYTSKAQSIIMDLLSKNKSPIQQKVWSPKRQNKAKTWQPTIPAAAGAPPIEKPPTQQEPTPLENTGDQAIPSPKMGK